MVYEQQRSIIDATLSVVEQSMKRCLTEAYKKCDEAFLSEATKVYVDMNEGKS